MIRYRSIVSSATRLEKVYIKGCLEREMMGRERDCNLWMLDSASCIQKRDWKEVKGRIEYICSEYLTRRSWGVPEPTIRFYSRGA